MTSAFPATAWLYRIGGGVLGVFGLWLLYWSLLHDRSRGRRRCPRCWYDMSGTPGNLTCSECGKVVKRERKFFKTRRRWRWAMVALVLLLSGGFGAGWPKLNRDGAISLVPMTPLVLLTQPAAHAVGGGNSWGQGVIGQLHVRLSDARNATPYSDPMWDWQWRILASGCAGSLARLHAQWRQSKSVPPQSEAVANYQLILLLNEILRHELVHPIGAGTIMGTPLPVDVEVIARDQWPETVPIDWRFHLKPTFGPPGWYDVRVLASLAGAENSNHLSWLPKPTQLSALEASVDGLHAGARICAPPGNYKVIFTVEVRLHSLWNEVYDVPYQTVVVEKTIHVGSSKNATQLQAIRSEELSGLIAGSIHEREVRQRDGAADFYPMVLALAPECTPLIKSMSLAVSAELLLDGKVIATGSGVFKPKKIEGDGKVQTRPCAYLKFVGNREAIEQLQLKKRDDAGWSHYDLRLRGDRTTAFSLDDAPAFWDGEVTVNFHNIGWYQDLEM